MILDSRFCAALWLFAAFGVGGKAQRIAVIGGALSGAFSSKYLADYDSACKLDSLTVFEPVPVNGTVDPEKPPSEEWQGSRIASVKLKDGLVVELGASIAYKDFHLVTEMLRGDPSIEIGPPFTTSTSRSDKNLKGGMAIYDGEGRWPLLTTYLPTFLRKFQIIGRYNLELKKVSKLCQAALRGFAKLPQLLDSLDPGSFFESPDDVWEAIGLKSLVHSSYDAVLDTLGLEREPTGWRRLAPYQGPLRSELLTAINLVNYNQDNSQVNGIVGLGSFAATSGGLFSIVGGNYHIVQSAMKQATKVRINSCGGKQTIEQVEKRVASVLGTAKGFILYGTNDEILGEFDIVLLAAPLLQSRIKFLIQSHWDEAVIQPMPLAGLINAHDDPSEEGHKVLPRSLPESATRPYTQVVTTVVSNGALNGEYLSLDDAYLPRSIIVTTKGKSLLHNITAITQISSSGVFKVFSNDRLADDTLKKLFGPGVQKEYVKVWGGQHGGATPDYQGQGVSTNFLLYDGSAGMEGKSAISGALYYPPAMELSSLASMEISAVGARAVAKLVARRVGLIDSKRTEGVRDEL